MQRKRFRRTREFGRRVLGYFPLTLAGLVLAAGCVLALLYYGLRRIDLILLAVGAAGIGIAALCLLLTLLGALRIWLAARRQAEEIDALRLECGYWAPTGFWLPSLWYLPFVNVSWTWTLPAAEVRVVRRRGRLHEQINAHHRDAIGHITRRFEIGDIFGLTSIAFSRTQKRSVSLLPWIGALRQMHVVRGMAGGADISHPEGPPEGDPFDMRRYVHGDPIRYVLWKVFAKSRDLVVREPERAISPSRQTVAYLVAAEGDDPAAGAARVAVDVGAFGGEWTLGADGCEEVADCREEALELLTKSARATENQSGAGLARFLHKASKGTVGRAVVFVPPTPGPWLDRVLKAIQGIAGETAQIEFLVGTDGIRRPPPRSWWRRLLFGRKRLEQAEQAARLAEAEQLAAVVRKLGGTRLRVLVVDRPGGMVFGPSHLKKLGV